MPVPRRELNGLVLGLKKLLALAKELGMTKEQCTLHTDSVVCIRWVEKKSSELTVFVHNRVKKLQQAGIRILRTDTSENPADLISKVKPVKEYVNNKFWMEGPAYLKQYDETWRKGRYIQKIKIEQTPLVELQAETENECKSTKEVVRINFIKVAQKQAHKNIITKCLQMSFDLTKVLHIILICLQALLKMTKHIRQTANITIMTELAKRIPIASRGTTVEDITMVAL